MSEGNGRRGFERKVNGPETCGIRKKQNESEEKSKEGYD